MKSQKEKFIDYLRLLAPISEAEKEMVENTASRGKYRAKDYLLLQGDVCTHIYFITRGVARFGFIDAQGNDISYTFRAENEFITDYRSFLRNEPSKGFIQAIEDLECLKLDRYGLNLIYEQVTYGDRIGRKISESLFLYALDRIDTFYNNSPEERYFKLLDKQASLVKRIPQAYIASHIGVRPQSLSRIKKRFSHKV